MTHCKQGDLAIIIKSRHPENVGKIVEVVRTAHKGEISPIVNSRRIMLFSGGRWTGRTVWWVRTQGSPLLAGNEGGFPVMERAYGDQYLRPIPKLDEPEEVTTNQDLGVLA